MSDYKIEAKVREEKPSVLRKQGLIPAIVYGKGFNNTKIALDKNGFMRLYKEAGTSNLVNLSVDGKDLNTLIHDIQLDPIRDSVLHVDFFKVNMKEKIQTEIPFKFIGESPAVIDLEGSLITNKDSIEVECLPGDLISEIEVDISGLDDFEKNIKVEDILVPQGIEILDDKEEVVAFIQEPRSEEELEALDTEVVENVEAVEVEKGAEEGAEGETDGSSAEAKDENKEKE